MAKTIIEAVATVMGVMMIGLIIISISSFFGAMAWNYVMPEMFGMKEITYLQFFCLSFVSALLIKSNNAGSSK